MVAARAMAIPANRKISTPGGLTAFGTNSGRIGLVKACWGAANGVLRWIGKHARVQWGSHAESTVRRCGKMAVAKYCRTEAPTPSRSRFGNTWENYAAAFTQANR